VAIDAEIVEDEVASVNKELANVNKELGKVDEKTSWLTESEKYALDYFQKNYQKGGASTYPIAPSTQVQLYALYLQGRTLSEIRQLNHPSFSLGQIVYSAVENDWEGQRKEYLAGLMGKARERLQQIGCESVGFLADSLAAAHKQHGEALQKYIQSGNVADLGAFGIGSVRQYKEVAELILRMTGQDKTSTLNVKGEVLHTANTSPSSAPQSNTGKSLLELAADKKAREKK
jgi:hypothetical protein